MENQNNYEKESLVFSGVDIYYNYVFDLGLSVNPIDAARSILGTDIGQAFLNPQTGKFEIADKYQPWVQYHEKLKEFQAEIKRIEELNANPTLLNHLKILKHHPIRYGKIYFRGFTSALSKEKLSDKEQETDDQNNQSQKENDLFLEHDKSMAQITTDLLGLLAIHTYVDKEIFFMEYLDEIPFIRVGLQPFGARIADHSIDFDVTLTLHRTGIAVLTAYGLFDSPLSLEEILKLTFYSQLPLNEFEVSTSALVRYLSLARGFEVSQEFVEKEYPSEHKGFTTLKRTKEETFDAVFDVYRYFITETIQGKKYHSMQALYNSLRRTGWYGYPILFIKETLPKFTNGTELKNAYSSTLAKLILRTSFPLKPEVIRNTCDCDLSISDNYSLFLTEGSATVLYYEQYELGVPLDLVNQEWVRQKFLTTVVVDLLILQRYILLTFVKQTDGSEHDLVALNELKREYLLLLEEFESLGLSHYGTVHDIIKQGQSILKINDLRKFFELKINSIEGLIKVAEEERRVKTERVVKILTTLIATILSLKAIQSFVDVFLSWSRLPVSIYPNWIAVPYNRFIDAITSHPTRATIFVYLVVVILTIVILWSGSIKNTKWKILKGTTHPQSREKAVSPLNFEIRQIKKEEVSPVSINSEKVD